MPQCGNPSKLPYCDSLYPVLKTYYFFNEFYLIKFSNCKTDARNEWSNNTQIMVQKSENMSFIIYLIFFAIELIASLSWWSRSIVAIIIITDIEIISIAFDYYDLEISGLLPEFYQFSFASKLHYSMQSYTALIWSSFLVNKPTSVQHITV